MQETTVKVQSDTNPNHFYTVNKDKQTCTCPSHLFGKNYCKHLVAILGENPPQLVLTPSPSYAPNGYLSPLPTQVVEVSKDHTDNMRTYHKYVMTRLSPNFILRDFMYSTEAEVLGVPNRPSDSPQMVVRAGKALCEEVLEKIIDAFGPISITFGYQTRAVIEAGLVGVKKNSSNPHQWDRGTYGNEIYARVDILPHSVEDGLISKGEFGKWLMYNLDIDLLMMWEHSNVFCITIGPKKRRVWLEWVKKGKGDNGSNRIDYMAEKFWTQDYLELPKDKRPKFGPSLTGGKMW